MQELLKQYIRDLLHLTYAAWTAPADQAVDLIGALVGQLLTVCIIYLTLRWLWNKIF